MTDDRPDPTGGRSPLRKPAAIAAGTVVGALLLITVATGNDDTESTSPAPPTTATSPPITTPSTASTPDRLAEAEPSSAISKLANLPIKGRAPKTGYDRSLFGETWTDDVTVADGHNGCDTRNDILRRDLTAVDIKPGSNGCAVLAGTLHDPYTGTIVEFRRGQRTSSQVQIDHVVALSDAWQKGAQQWDATKRRNFANDPINLQATIGSVNQRKGDGDAATWLPPDKSYRCTYVSRIVDIKSAYGLWVTQAEHDAIARILADCGAPTAATDSVPAPIFEAPPTTTLAPAAVAPAGPVEAGSPVYYPNCKTARAAGAAAAHPAVSAATHA